MKRMLVALVCAAALGLHASQLEEARQIIREAVEKRGNHPSTLKNMERWKDMVLVWKELDNDEKSSVLSVYCELLSDHFADLTTSRQLGLFTSSFYYLDGWDLASYGNQEALDWTRRIVIAQKGQGGPYTANGYLVAKGDARDLDIVGDRFEGFLAMRVAGTNLFYPYTIRYEDSLLCACTPSVTNTGPQALYVEAILKQAWNALDIEYRSWKEGSPPYHFRDISKIPEELLTMVVWFDEDGNPVCNVDLAKYGLTMPEIDLPQNVKDEILRRARPNVEEVPLTGSESPSRDVSTAETPCATEQSPPPSRPWLYAVILSALCAGVALWLIRKKR